MRASRQEVARGRTLLVVCESVQTVELVGCGLCQTSHLSRYGGRPRSWVCCQQSRRKEQPANQVCSYISAIWVSPFGQPVGNTMKAVSCRTLLCERGLLQRADGSARWCQDKTCVVAAIYGPRTTLGRKEDPEQAVVEVVFKPKSGVYRYNAPGSSLGLHCTWLSNQAVMPAGIASCEYRQA